MTTEDWILKVAILPWGNVIEDYIDAIEVSVEAFATEMEGGWLFGYADALFAAGAGACIIVVSRDAKVTRKIVNSRTGIATIVLPSPVAYTWLNRLPGMMRVAPYAALPRRALADALQREGCTHVIMQEYADPRFDRLVPLVRRLGLPVVATFQGGQSEPTVALGRAMRRKAIYAADGVIIASSEEEKRVRRLYRAELKIGRIFNPIDPKIWFPEDRGSCREALAIPSDARIAICHCRIDIQRKGLDILLAAWRSVVARHKHKDLRLHLIGNGPDRDTLRDEIKRDPVSGLRWIDRFTQDRAEMRRELSAADLHVQVSRHEGFSVAPMEAMACGLPTILSRVPGATDLLQNGELSGGLLIPIGDVSALAQGLETLLFDDMLRMRMAKVARSHALDVAATDSVGRQLVDFLSNGEK